MTQKDKELLLKDLYARLPYGVIVKYMSRESEGDVKLGCGNIGYVLQLGNGWWKECKPYLRPMSSMTEEEEKEINKTLSEINDFSFRMDELLEPIQIQKTFPTSTIDVLNKFHFDYRGLIPKGLAIAVTKENNPYKKSNQ